ncbi:unnamed protein product [Toxocara canis]|uniref:MFS domain-containing protein n=1 Tax=Toxocara canis TaxID=6265 RepID=A0A183V8H4_TOXCA|nr:unnamed protein product [Toxocara canis]
MYIPETTSQCRVRLCSIINLLRTRTPGDANLSQSIPTVRSGINSALLGRRQIPTDAVLTLYVINILAFSSTNATILFHAFVVLSYTSPLLGSTLADGYIGKFWFVIPLHFHYV